MKTLYLTLKKKWFYMIKSGEKLEEYREIKEFWTKRLLNRHYDAVVFTLGYPSKDDEERRVVFKNPRMRIGKGRTDWGAEEGKDYYVITRDKPGKDASQK